MCGLYRIFTLHIITTIKKKFRESFNLSLTFISEQYKFNLA